MPWFRRLLLDHANTFAPPGIIRIPSSTFLMISNALPLNYKLLNLFTKNTQFETDVDKNSGAFHVKVLILKVNKK